MILRNLNWKDTEWLINHGKVKSISRSSSIAVNDVCTSSPINASYYDWIDFTQEISDFYEGSNLDEVLRGYNVEVSSIDSDFPQSILERANLN